MTDPKERGQAVRLEESTAVYMEALRANSYPGRGIIMGLSGSEMRAIQVYWVMGRSENSRNREFAVEGKTVRTVAHDPSKVKDPSLIIYTAMRSVNGAHIVSNGDQTDTIAGFIRQQKTFQDALNTRTYEPDGPNFTPRISGIIDVKTRVRTQQAVLSVIRKDGESDEPIRIYYPVISSPGFGFCVHTYERDAVEGGPLPSFKKAPYPVLLRGRAEEIAQTYWDLLNAENRVALAVKEIDFSTGGVAVSHIDRYNPQVRTVYSPPFATLPV